MIPAIFGFIQGRFWPAVAGVYCKSGPIRSRGFFRFAHIDGLIPADPAVYARLPKVQRDESRTQGPDRLELIRFLQVAQTISVHHGALAYLLGVNALHASEAAAVRIEDYADTAARPPGAPPGREGQPPGRSPCPCSASSTPAVVTAPRGG